MTFKFKFKFKYTCEFCGKEKVMTEEQLKAFPEIVNNFKNVKG